MRGICVRWGGSHIRALAAAALLSPPVLALVGPAPAAAQADAAVFLSLVDQAEAKSTARDWAAAAGLWERVVRLNSTEGRFWSRLGMAHLAAKNYRAAIPALQRSVELGHGFPENGAYNIACAYAQLGDEDRAFEWLERALAMRYLDLDLAMRDPDLAPIRSDPRFVQLIPLAKDVSGMSRAQGWGHDLDVLQWQIDRLGYAPYRLKPRAWFQERFAALAASTTRRTDLQLALDLADILGQLGDGHSGLNRGNTADWALSLPLQFRAFPEGVFITGAAPAHRELLGAQLLAYGEHGTADVMRRLEAGVGRDNDSFYPKLAAAQRIRYTALLHAAGFGAQRDAATLRLRMPDGTERRATVAADMTQPDIWNQKPAPPGWATMSQTLPRGGPLYLRDQGRNYWFEHLPEHRSVYWAFNTLRDTAGEPIAAFAKRLMAFLESSDVQRLIIDLRHNNGGNAQLMTPVLAALLGSQRINRPGHLVVLIGPRTFSAAQSAAAMLDRFTEAVFVGEPTGSSPNFIGEEDAFTLPYSKLVANVSHLFHQSGIPQDRRTWIAPLLHIPVTFADYRAGRDPALDAVLAMPIPGDAPEAAR